MWTLNVFLKGKHLFILLQKQVNPNQSWSREVWRHTMQLLILLYNFQSLNRSPPDDK